MVVRPGNEAEKTAFFDRRNVLIESVAKNGSFRDLREPVVSVVSEQSRGHSYTHRGRLMSLRKYKQKTGQAPPAAQVTTATSRSGKRKEVVKVYDHDDSSSWSFSDKEASSVGMKRELDSGKVSLKAGQAEHQFEAAIAAQEGEGPKGNHATVSKMAALEAEKASPVPVATPAGQSGQAAPVQTARDVARAAQEARDLVAEGRETLSRATALLQPGGPKVKSKYAKSKAAPKGTKAAGSADVRKKAVKEFVVATR